MIDSYCKHKYDFASLPDRLCWHACISQAHFSQLQCRIALAAVVLTFRADVGPDRLGGTAMLNAHCAPDSTTAPCCTARHPLQMQAAFGRTMQACLTSLRGFCVSALPIAGGRCPAAAWQGAPGRWCCAASRAAGVSRDIVSCR